VLRAEQRLPQPILGGNDSARHADMLGKLSDHFQEQPGVIGAGRANFEFGRTGHGILQTSRGMNDQDQTHCGKTGSRIEPDFREPGSRLTCLKV